MFLPEQSEGFEEMVGVQPGRVHSPIGISGATQVGEENDPFDAFGVVLHLWKFEQLRC